MIASTALMRVLAVLAALAATVAAQEPAVKAVACSPSLAMDIWGAEGAKALSAQDWKGAARDCGTVHPKASVAKLTLPLQQGQQLLLHVVAIVAIDATKADAPAADVLRLDCSGKGQFVKAPTVPLKRMPAGPDEQAMLFRVEPTEVELPLPSGTLPAIIEGEYCDHVGTNKYQYVNLKFGTALEGSCKCGDKAVKVRIVDGDGSLTFGQKASFAGSVRVGGDTLWLDAGDGSFGKDAIKAFYGQPVRVNGNWYEIALTEDGKRISASPVKAEEGKLKVDREQWSATLVDEKGQPLWLKGGKEAVAVPAGKYKLSTYAIDGAAEKNGKHASIYGSAYPATRSVDVAAGKTAELAIGAPLTAQIDAQVAAKGQVELSLDLRDAGGSKGVSVRTAGGGPPPEPGFTVRDAAGKEVYSGKMAYG